jgi:hypothetical protein
MMTEDNNYTGPERRRGPRRKKTDRREEVRFEPEKKDRRGNAGRRKSDKDGDLWKFNP